MLMASGQMQTFHESPRVGIPRAGETISVSLETGTQRSSSDLIVFKASNEFFALDSRVCESNPDKLPASRGPSKTRTRSELGASTRGD